MRAVDRSEKAHTSSEDDDGGVVARLAVEASVALAKTFCKCL